VEVTPAPDVQLSPVTHIAKKGTSVGWDCTLRDGQQWANVPHSVVIVMCLQDIVEYDTVYTEHSSRNMDFTLLKIFGALQGRW
jgi:hypothetical protein